MIVPVGDAAQYYFAGTYDPPLRFEFERKTINDENVVLTSPAAAKILGEPSGTVRGNTALRNYFTRGLELYPDLHFELLDVMSGLTSIVVCYKNQKDTKTAEFMEFSKNGKVIRAVANYSA